MFGGNGQSATAGTALPNPLIVEVTDAFGNPVSGVTVNWAMATGGGSVSAPTSTTGPNGFATIIATLGTTAGANTFTATVGGLTGSPLTFTETGTAGAAQTLVIHNGDNQLGTVGASLSNPLVVLLTDANNNPVSGATVTWTTANGGNFSGAAIATSVTGSDGLASIIATLGTTSGPYTFNAAVGILPSVTFHAIANAGSPASITVTAGNGQSTLVAAAFPTPLAIKLTDKYGNPVPGVSVSFVAPTTGRSGTFTGGSTTFTISTNSSGTATATTFTANLLAGPYTVTASAAGLTANFSLTNRSPLGSSPNAIFVQNVYGLLLNRVADSGAQAWVSLLNAGTAPATVILDIQQSTEYLNDLVNGLYLHYLHRAADPGAQAWVNQLAAGATIESVTASILGTTEYFNHQGAANTGFVQGLYRDVLGRTGSNAAVMGWVNALNAGATRTQVAFAFLTSTEYRTGLVAGGQWTPYYPNWGGYYPTFLLRQAGSSALAAWVGALNAGMTDQAVLAAIFGSNEGYGLWS